MTELPTAAVSEVDTRTARTAPSTTSAAFLGIVRDIARGGLAGLVVGFVVAGLGSRIAMRIAGALVPEAIGLRTENGFPIGRVTLDGTLGLVLFGGAAASVFLAVTWVVISPWLPRRLAARALLAVPIAIALGTSALIDARNPDFVVLRHDPLVVATLVFLIAALGPAMALVDAWLDGHLARPVIGASGAAMGYASFAAIGVLLAIVLVIQALLDPRGRAFGLTMLVTGAVTVAWWLRTLRGEPVPPRWMRRAAWASLAIGAIAGFADLVPDLQGALSGA
jgi:hypothetical protein